MSRRKTTPATVPGIGPCEAPGCKGVAAFCGPCADAAAVAYQKRRNELEARITKIRREVEWMRAHPVMVAIEPRLDRLEHDVRLAGLERALELLEA